MKLQANFNAIREQYAPVFDALERALKKFDVDFYLIGAHARDVWISHLGIVNRLTKDIDYYVLVGNRATWNELNDYLITTEKFERDKNAPHRFYLKEHIIDIIPFGDLQEGDEVHLDDPPIEISVFGCKEVAVAAEEVGNNFKVVTLPGLCILKMVAYSEKSDRVKDWDDFLLITNNYSYIAGEQLFDGNYHDLLDDDFDIKLTSARMLGRQMNSILGQNNALKRTILYLLNSKLAGFTMEEIDVMYNHREPGNNRVATLKMISQVLKGIMDD